MCKIKLLQRYNFSFVPPNGLPFFCRKSSFSRFQCNPENKSPVTCDHDTHVGLGHPLSFLIVKTSLLFVLTVFLKIFHWYRHVEACLDGKFLTLYSSFTLVGSCHVPCYESLRLYYQVMDITTKTQSISTCHPISIRIFFTWYISSRFLLIVMKEY